jgi:chemotaxis protein MotB
MLTMIASQLGKMPNNLLIEGHTDAKPYNSSRGYSNWELSAERADSARKLMQDNGVRSNQVSDVGASDFSGCPSRTVPTAHPTGEFRSL